MLCVIFMMMSALAAAQPVTIPDAAFRARILAQVPGTSELGTQVIFTTPAVTDVTMLNVSFDNISNLTGIGAFTGLIGLNCGFNLSLTSVDLSNNPLLEEFTAFRCALTGTLDLTNNPALKFLSVQSNSITAIDISNCPLLEEFNCNNNQLTAIDVSNKPALRSFSCFENQLTVLDVSGSPLLEFLDCSINSLNGLDVSQNPNLQTLRCNINNITSLNLSNNPLLTRFNCSDNQLTTLDLSASPNIDEIFCFNNQLTSLIIGNNPVVFRLYCYSNQLTSLDISQCSALTDFDCSNNQLTGLDLSNNPSLVSVFCFNNQLTTLNVANCLSLERLECGFNQLSTLTVASPNLVTLECQENQLTSLDISACASLDRLTTSNNLLTSLNVSNNTVLTQLGCNNNQLTTLNVSACALLQSLVCSFNLLGSIDLTNNPALSSINLGFNQLTTLQLGNKPSLASLNFQHNQLVDVNLSNAPILSFLIGRNNLLRRLDVSNSPLSILRVENNRIPIILQGVAPIGDVVRDGFTQLAVKRSEMLSPSVSAGQTGAFVFGTTGAIVNLTTNTTSTTASLTGATGSNPTTVPPLPLNVVNISPDQFWTITESGLTTVTYNLILDLSAITNIGNFFSLKVLKRANSSSPWQDVALPPISATVQYVEPFIIVNGLTDFSDFAIGGDSDNPLPVQLSRFTGGSTPSGVALAWTTASEVDNAGFGIVRDGIEIATFQNTPTLRGRGTTSETTQYTFTDATVEVGHTYQYTLRSYDFNGTRHDYPNTVSVEVTENSDRTFRYDLAQNYPNPFNPSTWIEYELASAGDVRLEVFDMLGRKVATLVSARQNAGVHRINFNARTLSSGVYFYTIRAGRFSQTKKMMLIK